METLTVEQAREQLQMVFKAYPSFEQSLRTLSNPKETTSTWAAMLTKGDAAFVRSVVTDIVSGDFDPVDKFDKWDALPRNILKEADRRRERVWQKHRTERYGEAAKSSRGTMRALHSELVGHIAIWLGEDVKSGAMSRNDCSVMLEELLDWEFREGQKPEWIEEYLAKAKARRDEKKKRDPYSKKQEHPFEVGRIY